MGKTAKLANDKITTAELAGENFTGEAINHVKKSFDGLTNAVGKLPESKEKNMIVKWAADSYLAASKTIFSLTEKFAPAGA